MAKFYSKLSETGQNLFILIAIALIGLVALSPFFFFSKVGLGLGWFLGSGIEILCYLSIVFAAKVMGDTSGKHSGLIGLAVVFSFARLALYAGGLALSAFYTYKLKTDWLNMWTVFVAYLPLGFVLGIKALIGFVREKKGVKAPSAEPSAPEKPNVEEKKPAVEPAVQKPVSKAKPAQEIKPAQEVKPAKPVAEDKPIAVDQPIVPADAPSEDKSHE